MGQQLFAFWCYDRFPYVLGAPFTSMDSKGYVRAEGHDGRRFLPFKILPVREGRALLASLKALGREHDEALEKIHQQYIVKRNALIRIPPRGERAEGK